MSIALLTCELKQTGNINKRSHLLKQQKYSGIILKSKVYALFLKSFLLGDTC